MGTLSVISYLEPGMGRTWQETAGKRGESGRKGQQRRTYKWKQQRVSRKLRNGTRLHIHTS